MKTFWERIKCQEVTGARVNVATPVVELPSIAVIVNACVPSNAVGMVNVTVLVLEVLEEILAPLKSLVCPDKEKVKEPVPPDALNTTESAVEKLCPDGETVMLVVVSTLELVLVPLVSTKAAS